MVFVSIELDVMVDAEFVDDDDGVGDDNVGGDDVVAIIDKIVFNGEPAVIACAWPIDAFDAIALLSTTMPLATEAAQANWHWTVILFGNAVVVVTVCTENGMVFFCWFFS